MSFVIDFEVIESSNEIAQLILQELAQTLNIIIPKRMSVINARLRQATFKYLQDTETYDSLVNDLLAVHFGIPFSGREARINRILQAIVDRMEIEFVPLVARGFQFDNGIQFRLLTKSLSEVLSLPEGIVITEKNVQLDWIQWLLLMGDTIIVQEYDVKLKPGSGRSGGGIMEWDAGDVWRVPSKFSGTINDNWLTRALVDNAPLYLSIIKQELESILQV